MRLMELLFQPFIYKDFKKILGKTTFEKSLAKQHSQTVYCVPRGFTKGFGLYDSDDDAGVKHG